MPEGESNHWRSAPEDDTALAAASETLHRPQKKIRDRNRGKLGLALGLAAGLAAGYMKWGNRREEVTPQVRAQVVGVLLCGPAGCVALQPEELEEFGNGCEDPSVEIPPECLGGIPQDFSKNIPQPEAPEGVEL